MPPARIVEPLDVIEHVRLGFRTSTVHPTIDPLDLQGGEEALHRRVVPDIPGATHAAGDAVVGEQPPELFTGVLATLVRMMKQRFGRPRRQIAISSASVMSCA